MQPSCEVRSIIIIPFKHEKPETQKTSNLPRITQLVNGRVYFSTLLLRCLNHTPNRLTRRDRGDHGDDKDPIGWQMTSAKTDEQFHRNFWRHSLTARIRAQWLHAHILGHKYYLNYGKCKNDIPICMLWACACPWTFGLSLRLGQLLGSWARGSRQRLPGMGTAARGGGTNVLRPAFTADLWRETRSVGMWFLRTSAAWLHQNGKILSVRLLLQ